MCVWDRTFLGGSGCEVTCHNFGAATAMFLRTFPDLTTLAACAPAMFLSLPVAIGLTKFGIAMLNSCDTVTARATLPAGAFSGKVVWITGASSGLGREMARQLGKLGAVLILSARSTEGLEETKGEVIAAGARPEDVTVLPLDMEKLSEIPDAAARALEYYGGRPAGTRTAPFSLLRSDVAVASRWRPILERGSARPPRRRCVAAQASTCW